jgi:hypothetical protein
MESQPVKEGIKDIAEDLVNHAGDYLDTFYKTNLLKATGKAIRSGATAISSVVFAVLAVFIILFGSMGLAWWLGDVIESRAGGFLLVGGFYLLVLVILILTRKTVVLPFIRNFLTSKIYES